MDQGASRKGARGMTKRKSSSQHHHLNKVIGNLSEGQGYADKRKRKILSAYKKMLRKMRSAEAADATEARPTQTGEGKNQAPDQTDSERLRPSELPTGNRRHYIKNPKIQIHKQKDRYNPDEKKSTAGAARRKNDKQAKGKKTRYSETERQRKKQLHEHEEKLKEKTQRRESRENALAEYQRKKESRHKKLGKRTARGQPIMKYQMDHLLQKIQTEDL